MDLSSNGLGPLGAKALVEGGAFTASLTSLSLGYNSLGDEGVTAICEAVQSNKEMKLAYLVIEYNGVGPAGAKSVAAMVAVIPSLTQVCHIRNFGPLHCMLISHTVMLFAA